MTLPAHIRRNTMLAHEGQLLSMCMSSGAPVAADIARCVADGAMNALIRIEGAEAASPGEALGRWPANLVHDGSEEVLAAFPRTASGTGAVKKATASGHRGNAYGAESRPAGTPNVEYGDEGSAARFFYTAKADSNDRVGSKHPTVKPVKLMRWLCRLVTPKGGTILDPFAGTGTTGEAAWREGFNAILIEREPEYQADIARRMDLCKAGPAGRRRAIAKAKAKPDETAGPLFGGAT